MRQGHGLRITDPFGQQVSDVFAFGADDTSEALSSGRTLDNLGKYRLSTDDILYSNRSRPMLRIGADTVGCHDFLLTPCSQATFDLLYPDHSGYHPSCQENLSNVFSGHGISPDSIGTTFNVFMNVVPTPDGKIDILPGISQPSDYIELFAEFDLLVGVTSCSAEECNNNSLTPIDVEYLK